MKSLKILSEAVIKKWTDNAMAKEKGHMTAKLLVLRADFFVRTIEDTKG
jgi:hypothetical protein